MPATTNKKKKARDSRCPKRALSAFFLYMKANRAEFKSSRPDMLAKDIAQGLGKAWNELDKKKRRPYEKEAKALKKLYLKDKAVYDKIKKKEARPKRPMSSYLCFCNATRPSIKAESPDLSMTDIAKVLGQRWKAVAQKDRKKYVKQAEKLKKKYTKDVLAWETARTAAPIATSA